MKLCKGKSKVRFAILESRSQAPSRSPCCPLVTFAVRHHASSQAFAKHAAQPMRDCGESRNVETLPALHLDQQ
jgi:hypothetical protein